MIQRFFMLAPRIAALPPDVLMASMGLPDTGPLSPALVSTRIEPLPEGTLSLLPTLCNSSGLAEEMGRVRTDGGNPALAGPVYHALQQFGRPLHVFQKVVGLAHHSDVRRGATPGPTHPRIEGLRTGQRRE